MLYAVSSPKTCNCSISYPRIQSPYFHQKHLASTRLRVSAASSAEPNGVKIEYTPWLIVGLGNPGNKYHGTRHNVNIAPTHAGSIGEVPVLLAKPQTYMNFSGESVGPLAAYYRVPLRHILLVYDEMSLPNGVLRIQPKGGHGHHNGVKSVMEHLDGRREFPRFCIGVGNPPGTMDMKAFLLQKFSALEREQRQKAEDEESDGTANPGERNRSKGSKSIDSDPTKEAGEIQFEFHNPPRRPKAPSALAQSVPDFSSALRKENRKPVSPLPPVAERSVTPPAGLSKSGGIYGKVGGGSKSANSAEKRNGGLMARKSYASMEELKGLGAAAHKEINGGKNGRGIAKTVLGYRQF
ncbi:UNVERIFIED_CONTAM: Chloroplastic group IIB intron splicing facilitator CRS2-B, chloroplastic [Sesamum latifolium]|uniref:Chloroplastic group IIB intron splicing facilitator CRS2-B, chloroplastic n=1 Tax=Sesamum latifolium TaxID=2727402 RepID=A0AAW2Y969_9LAMI